MVKELEKLGVKVFARDAEGLDLKSLIPVFHSWIQGQKIEGHLLIDVHNYSHVHHGPGILLVAHEANFSLDEDEGRRGLLYQRKTPQGENLSERLRAAFETALQASSLLESDSELNGRLRFRNDEFLVLSNDRLQGPNTEETDRLFRPLLEQTLRSLFGAETTWSFSRRVDPKGRYTLGARLEG